ncbi:hypothetical protein PAPYR_7707 [Paratrimastix pyriformis]|uniref:Protein kinase domain-containing protein n=1 Tax=Paratrimastix pyriformis TaxID=342808 RepID=A0ABQ8UC83_9EUKA|nr:hypothetical protein PAPYR_7707 [Paratrimastix pyriformis]
MGTAYSASPAGGKQEAAPSGTTPEKQEHKPRKLPTQIKGYNASTEFRCYSREESNAIRAKWATLKDAIEANLMEINAAKNPNRTPSGTPIESAIQVHPSLLKVYLIGERTEEPGKPQRRKKKIDPLMLHFDAATCESGNLEGAVEVMDRKYMDGAAKSLIEGIDFMQRCGICHLDLQPNNIMLNVAPKRVTLIIADWHVNALLGTPTRPWKIGPLQPWCDTTQDWRSDLYALGWILFCLYGRFRTGKLAQFLDIDHDASTLGVESMIEEVRVHALVRSMLACRETPPELIEAIVGLMSSRVEARLGAWAWAKAWAEIPPPRHQPPTPTAAQAAAMPMPPSLEDADQLPEQPEAPLVPSAPPPASIEGLCALNLERMAVVLGYAELTPLEDAFRALHVFDQPVVTIAYINVTIAYTPMTEVFATVLGRVLMTKPYIRGLNMSCCNLTAACMRRLLPAIAAMPHLNVLMLDRNRLGTEAAQDLAALLRGQPVPGPDGTPQLLDRPHELRWLTLNGNQIDDEGALAIAAALQPPCPLRWLSMDQNEIGARGYAALGRALEQDNKTILKMSLIRNAAPRATADNLDILMGFRAMTMPLILPRPMLIPTKTGMKRF